MPLVGWEPREPGGSGSLGRFARKSNELSPAKQPWGRQCLLLPGCLALCHTWEAPTCTMGRGALHGQSTIPWGCFTSWLLVPTDVSPSVRVSRTHLLELIFLNIVSG